MSSLYHRFHLWLFIFNPFGVGANSILIVQRIREINGFFIGVMAGLKVKIFIMRNHIFYKNRISLPLMINPIYKNIISLTYE